jgi:glutamyl-tRNA synthetase
MSSAPRVRFAPSPTGKLHIGHLRAAIPNAFYAKAHQGSFMVRIEDTDLERHDETAEAAILDDLAWLGLHPDESPIHGGHYAPYRTRERAARGDYKDAVAKLMADGRAYECYTSEEELEIMRKLQRSRNEPPRYDNRHRDLTEAQKEAYRAEGRQPVIRFRMNDGTIKFQDLIRGEVSFQAENLGGDPVIVRSNSIPLFTLAGAVDDINMNITHVIRGEDHVSNTAQQVQIFEALGATAPVFAHLPMLLDKEGQKFSKRLGSLSIANLREQGIIPQALLAYMASLGFSHAVEPTLPLAEMAKHYDFAAMGRAPVRFDEDQLARYNATALHNLSWEEVAPYAEDFLDNAQLTNPRLPELWQTARANITYLAELPQWYALVFNDVASVVAEEDTDYIQSALQNLPQGPYTTESWQEWTGALKEQTGRKGKQLFMPLRQALTGQNHGPDMPALFQLMGEDTVRARLERSLG